MEGKKAAVGIFAIISSVAIGISKCGRGVEAIFNVGKVGKGIYKTEKLINAGKGINTVGEFSIVGKGINTVGEFSRTGKGINTVGELSKAGEGINTVGEFSKAGEGINTIEEFSKVGKIEDFKIIGPLSEEKPVNHFIKLELTEDGFCLNKGKALSEQDIKRIVTTDKKILIQGDLTEAHVNQLQKMGVDIVFNENVIKTIQQEKFVYIFASPKEDVELYKIFQLSSDIPNSVVVDDYKTLIKAIEDAKNNHMRPIIIYDSKTELLFNHSISEYNVTEVITCNSYKINSGNLSFSTLNEVNAIDVIESLRKVPNGTMYLDDLLFNFAENYNKIQDLRNYKKALIAVGIGSATTAGITSIVFFNNNK